MKKLGMIVLALALEGCLSYNKALVKCEKKCIPNSVKVVDYNYSTNRYDVCICNKSLEVKPLSEEEFSN